MSDRGTKIPKQPGIEQIESADNREIVIETIKDRESIVALKFALVLEDQGHLTHAAKHYKEIIENTKIMTESKDQLVLFCQDKLASIYRDSGSYDEAEILYQAILKEKTISLGKNHALTSQTAASLALFLRDRGYYGKALNIIQNKLGSEPQDFYQNIARTKLVSVLAVIFMDLRNIELSLYLTRNVLSASEVLLGPHDPFTLDQASNLALVLSELGNYRFAEMIDRRVLDTLEKTLGTNHPQSLNITDRLANNLRVQGRYKHAIVLFTQTLKVQEKRLGPSHPGTLSTKCGLAATYTLQHRFRDSKILLLQVNDGYMKIPSSEHPNRLWTVKALEYLQRLSASSKQDSLFESDTSDLSDDFLQTFKEHFSAISLRVVAQMNFDAGYEIGLAQPKMASWISNLCGTSLHKACFDENETEIAKLLMQPNPDINVQVGLFGTPLCVASFKGHTSIVKRLLDAGANPDVKGAPHGSALRVALMMDRKHVFRSLLEKKADPNIMDRWYGTPLHEASLAGQSDIVDLLLEFAAKPNLRGGIFGFALLASAWKGNTNIVKSLLREGAFLDAQEEGKTAFYLAQVEGHDEIVTTLREAATRRGIGGVSQSDSEAPLRRTDVVLRPGNPDEIHSVAASTPNLGHDGGINESSYMKDGENNEIFPVDSTLTNGRVIHHKPRVTPEHSEKSSVTQSGPVVDRSKISRLKKWKGFLKNKRNACSYCFLSSQLEKS